MRRGFLWHFGTRDSQRQTRFCSEPLRGGRFLERRMSGSKRSPPVAERVERTVTVHGRVLSDPYFWMSDRSSEKVRAYIEEERAYQEDVMGDTKSLQKQIYDELLGRMKEDDSTVPYKHGPWYYYRANKKGQPYSIYCRRSDASVTFEEKDVVLDLNELSVGREYVSLGIYRVSPCHRVLAYSMDYIGNERFLVSFKDMETMRHLDDKLPETYYSLEWNKDGRSVYYTTLDESNRPYRLWRHVMGTSASEDALLYEEEDSKFMLDLEKTRDGKWLILNVNSVLTSECLLLDLERPESEFVVFYPREFGVDYSVDHQNGRFLILTDEGGARNYKLMSVLVADWTPSSKQNWVEVIPHRPEVFLKSIDCFKNHLVVWEREGGFKTLRVQDLRTGEFRRVCFPDAVYTIGSSANYEYDTDLLRVVYSSLCVPKTVLDYNMDTLSCEVKKEEVVPNYDKTQYAISRDYAESSSPDGQTVRVPISMVYRKDLKLDGNNPTLLYGYGSYGICIEPGFSSKCFSLVDRGYVYAIAHIRGGGEMGRHWHDSGKLFEKKNTFVDFVAVAKHLIARQITSADRLAILGGSAGGLLIGAVLNTHASLFRVAVAKVPFVDCLNTMLDASIPLTTNEYEEWGNPLEDPRAFDYIRSYAPYENVRRGDYPATLVQAGFSDSRVAYWEPLKWVAMLRYNKSNPVTPLVLDMKMDHGHMGASDRYRALEEDAYVYAFILWQVGGG
ncbi:dipeptidyl aminopeptidase BI-like [Schistocerca gregaria]|uniref:dipeptidyl aminopeptidase BI-like n=1 Tax=Schistocerca gregaria TaxID=7010 RepID=UPI00211E18F2|nr:dipeptidyl aminopeptidase BI-like [Schistocerca gregaria]